MLVERIEGKWIEVFARVFEMCAVNDTQSAAILSETQSRSVNVNLAELALDESSMATLNSLGFSYNRVTLLSWPICKPTSARYAFANSGRMIKTLIEKMPKIAKNLN